MQIHYNVYTRYLWTHCAICAPATVAPTVHRSLPWPHVAILCGQRKKKNSNFSHNFNSAPHMHMHCMKYSMRNTFDSTHIYIYIYGRVNMVIVLPSVVRCIHTIIFSSAYPWHTYSIHTHIQVFDLFLVLCVIFT